ncbi:hypothetical protein H1R20_g4678, partial [Candolleomyces eurysporus]
MGRGSFHVHHNKRAREAVGRRHNLAAPLEARASDGEPVLLLSPLPC